jgi:dihydroorotase
MHVHLRQPGNEESETVETGLKAAVSGGVTTVGVMPNTDPPMDSPEEVDRLLRNAASAPPVRVIPIPCVTLGRMGREPVDFAGLAEMGVTAFTDDGDPVRDSGILLQALDHVHRFGGVIVEHPEDKSLAGGSVNLGPVSRMQGVRGIPAPAETVDVARCLEVAGASDGRLHLTHLSLPRSVELVRDGLFRDAGVTLDVTPHHLALDETALLEHGTAAKMNPPLRTPEQREKLVEMVRLGMVDAVASDHAPHSAGAKDRPLEDAAFGISGLETLLPVTMEVLGKAGMEPLQILRLLITGPAGVLGISAPGLRDGCRADCVLFDPQQEYRLLDRGTFSLSRNTPFLGRVLRGSVKAVWIGELVYRDGEFAKV